MVLIVLEKGNSGSSGGTTSAARGEMYSAYGRGDNLHLAAISLKGDISPEREGPDGGKRGEGIPDLGEQIHPVVQQLIQSSPV